MSAEENNVGVESACTEITDIKDVIRIIQSKKRLPFEYDKLSWEDSKKCDSILTKVDVENIQPEWKEALVSFILCSDPYHLFEHTLVNKDFLHILKTIIPHCHFATIVAVFKSIFNQFLKEMSNYKGQFLQFLEYLNDRHLLLKISMYYLETLAIDDPKMTECLGFLELYLTAVSTLRDYSPTRLSTLISELYFEMIRCKFTIVVTQLLLQSDIDDNRHSLIQAIVSHKLEISNFLSEIILEESPFMRDKLNDTIEQSFDGDEDLKKKLDSIENLVIDPSEMSLLQVLDVVVFLKEPDLSFKRIFIEHLLFGGNPFPFYKAVSRISDELHEFFVIHQSEIKQKPYLISFIMNKESFLESIMKVQLKVWIESGASTKEDMESLFRLIPVILEELDSLLQRIYGTVPLDEIPDMVNNFIRSIDYRKGRGFQLDLMRESQLRKWDRQMIEFDSILFSQVQDFVKNQRLLQFQRGIWVYSQNPTDTITRTPRVYFTVVSDNQLNLLVKEFDSKTEEDPIVEGMEIVYNHPTPVQPLSHSATIVIPLKSILFFESRSVSLKSASSSTTRLISLGQNNGYTKVKLLDKNRKRLLKVYLDTDEKKSIWLDGLQLLSPLDKKEGLSSETKGQLQNLVALRKDVQLVNLTTRVDLDAHIGLDSDDSEYYDLDTLISLPNHSYYE